MGLSFPNRCPSLMGTIRFIQAIAMKTTENSMQEAKDYNVSASIALDENRQAFQIILCACIRIASTNLGVSAHCKHVLALIYAVFTVVDAGVVSEWPVCRSSMEQTRGLGHASTATRDWRPGRAHIHASFLRPDRGKTWTVDKKSRAGPNMAIYSRKKWLRFGRV